MLFTLQTIVMVMCVRNHAGYEKMKHGILCLILLLHETENSMCHLLCLAVLLYSALPPAEIWANKLCCHLKQGTRYLNTRVGKELAYRCIYRDYLSSVSCVKKIQATSNQCFQPCYYNFLIWKLENHMTKHVI
jgi:hypothetical protein